MKNSITVQITFSFQGVTYSPSAVIELDPYLEKNAAIPDFYTLVARHNQIDIYSYQYEVMELGEYRYFDAQGLARDFCSEDHFDLEGFRAAWKAQNINHRLTEIARQTMGIDSLEAYQGLREALLQAYQLGSDSD